METLEITKLIEQFELRHDRCPRDFAEIRGAGLTPRDRMDPWDQPYVLLCDEVRIGACSLGKDGIASADDICEPGYG